MTNEQAIAILDSGVGGLTVVKEVMHKLPRERILYFGDTARAPYGSRSKKEVIKFTMQIVDYLLTFHPKIIVIACNTATALAIDEIRSVVDIPVVGVIMPGVRAAVQRSVNGRIGVIGTEGTIKSGAYETALRMLLPDARVVSLACPSFVPLVEKGLFRSAESYLTVYETLRELSEEPIDTLILGCTHYPFLSDTIGRCMGPDVSLISSAEHTAIDIHGILSQHGWLNASEDMPAHHFFCSGNPQMFQTIAVDWLRHKVHVHSVSLGAPKVIPGVFP